MEFLQQGAATFPTAEVTDPLLELWQAIVLRLEAQGIEDTPLQLEWKAMGELKIPEQLERRRLGDLGLDPLDLPPGCEQAIRDANRLLPEAVQNEFFRSAHVDEIQDQTQWVLRGLDAVNQSRIDLSRIEPYRRPGNGYLGAGRLPSEVGYQFARQLQSSLNLSADADHLDLEMLCGRTVEPSPAFQRPPQTFAGLVSIDTDHSLGYCIPKQRAESFRFAFCRGIGEYLFSTAVGPALQNWLVFDRA